ncbi:MAG: peptidylprolyl isomerase [Phycisphaerae bacterium]|nr:peptidylprolyl isomerase [Phycisphaerae bacterium]
MANRPNREASESSTRVEFMEPLESRQMLDATPFPAITSLENPLHTVVRMQTNFGDVDIELYDDATPGTVANFLNYVYSGRYDQTFFHRLVDSFVLQGGGFKFIGNNQVQSVPTFSAIKNEFRFSNIERTIAMAKLSGQPDSATSQFFFNIVDNPNLDSRSNAGGFTVFGKVVQGWTNIHDPVNFGHAANDSDIQNFFKAGIINNAALAEVPVRKGYVADTSPKADDFLTIIDVEVIKPQGVNVFYVNRIYYPEGFRGSTINEYLPVVNPNATTVFYQVIARFETSDRDFVMEAGQIAANARGGITISEFKDPANARVREGAPYAIELHSTLPVAANLSHFDFGTATGEALTGATSTSWFFGEGFKGKDPGFILDFLVWQNPNPVTANLQITFFPEGASPRTVNVATEAFRRGGLNIEEVSQVPKDGAYSTRIVSDQPIVAALSHYETISGGNGFGTLGVSGEGSTVGIVPVANVGSNVRNYLTVLNPNSVAAVVNYDLIFSAATGKNRIESVFIVPPNSRGGLDLSTIPQLADGTRVSIRYESNAKIYADTIHYENQDGLGTFVPTTAAKSWHFADGFMDNARAGTNVIETVSVFNPFQSKSLDVVFTFRYTDGFTLTRTVALAGQDRFDFDLHTYQPILDQGAKNKRFYYSIEVSAASEFVAMMRHTDITGGGGFATIGSPFGTTTALNSPIFGSGG